MKYILTSIGTRGDMEPLLAIGELLAKRGHRILCLFPEQFRSLAEDSGFDFESLGSEFIDMLNSPDGKAAMGAGGGGWKKMTATLRLAFSQNDLQKNMIKKQFDIIERENPDKVIHNGKAVYPVVWSLDKPNKTILIIPIPNMHYVKGNSHVAFHSDFGPFFNELTFKIANYGLVKTIMKSLKWVVPNQDITQSQIQKALFSNNAIYTISPTLFHRPEYWPPNIKVLGYHERNKSINWKPNSHLLDFLSSHKKILFITFGSMNNTQPEEKTEVMLSIVKKHRIPTIINTAGGGLIKPVGFNSNHILFTERIPYDWVLPKVYAIVHHGGSGSTHMGLKYGCPTLIIPHIIDQFVWNKIVFEKGAGPLGIKIGKINKSNLEPKILDLYTNENYLSNALKIKKSMLKEDFEEELYQNLIS